MDLPVAVIAIRPDQRQRVLDSIAAMKPAGVEPLPPALAQRVAPAPSGSELSPIHDAEARERFLREARAL